jgi:hypothetical protein
VFKKRMIRRTFGTKWMEITTEKTAVTSFIIYTPHHIY